MPRQFPPEFRQRALRMLEESVPDHETDYAAIHHVASKLGVGPEALRKWRRQSEVDSAARPGRDVGRVRRDQAAELRRANEILRAASAFLLWNSTAPTARLSGSSSSSRTVAGSRPSAALWARQSVVPHYPRHRAAKYRPPSVRALSDVLLGAEIAWLHGEIYGVNGVWKMHALMRRHGWAIGRDQTARIMRNRGAAARPAEQTGVHHQGGPGRRQPGRPVETQFAADAPRRPSPDLVVTGRDRPRASGAEGASVRTYAHKGFVVCR